MYDPLLQQYPKTQESYPDSYWSSDLQPPTVNQLNNDVEADIAIIGGGYTGLSTAYHLSKSTNKKVVILEANHSGWGCSGRNAGFVLAGTGRLSLQQMADKWGKPVSQAIYKEYLASIDTLSELINVGNIDCDLIQGGYLKIAHNKEQVNGLKKQVEALNSGYGQDVQFVSEQQIQHSFIKAKNTFGGIYYPQCFAINPLKMALGIHHLTSQAGVEIYSQSPVIDWQQKTDLHQLITPKGTVTASQVVIASNGYTGKSLHPLVKNRHFPVLSSVIVTRPLNELERQKIAMRAGLMAMDTRSLKYYYRLLPDGRLLFGGRGAIKGKNANDQIYAQRLLQGLKNTFPDLASIQIDYFWSGWVSVSFDDYPRIAKNEDSSVFYSMGYCGSGVAFANHAGKRLAQFIQQDNELPDLPFWQSPLRKFPFAAFRRVGLAAFYNWAKLTH